MIIAIILGTIAAIINSDNGIFQWLSDFMKQIFDLKAFK